MICDIDAIRQAYLGAPEEAVFLERARVLRESQTKYISLPPGVRQGRIIKELCERITPVVNPKDILLHRVLEQVPSPGDETFIEENLELFIHPGLPGWLDSTSIYIPDWEKLLRLGIPGLVCELDRHIQAENGTSECSCGRRDYLEGVRISLLGISRLINRYADEAEKAAGPISDGRLRARLSAAALCCSKVAVSAPETFREALQLFAVYHMVLSCVIGGRNVTPGRMDQYLSPFYERDVRKGNISRSEGVELLAAMMIGLSQLGGSVATDFQSRKRSANKFSHYYITLAGTGPEGRSAVNDLSFAFLEAVQIVNSREPSLSIRYSDDIDRTFWRKAVELMRARMPVFAYNDYAVIPALVSSGLTEPLARTYAHAGCMNCLIPGGAPCLRDSQNLPSLLLLALNGGRDLLADRQAGPATPSAAGLVAFDGVFEALRLQIRHALEQTAQDYDKRDRRYPLPAWPLIDGHLEAGNEFWQKTTKYADQHMVGLATAIDSLLVIRELVYREKVLSLEELIGILKQNFTGQETLRQSVMNRAMSYGSDDEDVTSVVDRLGNMWIEEVQRINSSLNGIRFRPGFHSWLYNMELGQCTPATPNGRLRGEALSSDILPSQGKARGPTETLNCMAHLPHNHTCSGGTTLRLSNSHFNGENGLDLLSALIESYFAKGGLQLHFIFADTATLQEAIKRPEEYRDLLVRVTGFSEYFVRLLPEVQQEIIRRDQID